jgi:hypothetical protein
MSHGHVALHEPTHGAVSARAVGLVDVVSHTQWRLQQTRREVGQERPARGSRGRDDDGQLGLRAADVLPVERVS